MDSKRDQNSVLLLKKAAFDVSTVNEVTAAISDSFDKSVPVANGDLLAITVQDKSGKDFMLASFHGDTNGLATIPVVSAVEKYQAGHLEAHTMVFGMDANTYSKGTFKKGKKKTQDVTEFAEFFTSRDLTSCWGDKPNPKNFTTFNARTFLQPQLNKAAKKEDKVAKGDINPKDFILFRKGSFKVLRTTKDNTGKRKYIEKMVFPTLEFPSDHGIIETTLRAS